MKTQFWREHSNTAQMRGLLCEESKQTLTPNKQSRCSSQSVLLVPSTHTKAWICLCSLYAKLSSVTVIQLLHSYSFSSFFSPYMQSMDWILNTFLCSLFASWWGDTRHIEEYSRHRGILIEVKRVLESLETRGRLEQWQSQGDTKTVDEEQFSSEEMKWKKEWVR